FFSSRRRHTRSKRDWSSDVCSSDLPDVILMIANDHLANNRIREYPDFVVGMAEMHRGPSEFFKGWLACDDYEVPGRPDLAELLRSEERRVGKEGVTRCRMVRWKQHV